MPAGIIHPEDKLQRQQQRQEKALIRLKQKQEQFRKIRKGELLPSDAKDSSDSENTSSTDSESESAGWAWKNKSVDVMNVKPYEGGRLEFHVPQDRIRIFIPGFDSNPPGEDSNLTNIFQPGWNHQLG